MKDERCEFCEAYNFKKQSYKVIRKMLLKQKAEPIKKEFTVAIVELMWNKSKKNASRTTDYRHLGLGYKLNYCPECGARLNGKGQEQ